MRTLSEDILDKVKDFNFRFQKEHGISPSFRIIQQGLHLGSVATARRYVLELERRGHIKRGEWGKIIPFPQLKTGNFTLAPLVGDVACGIPNIAEENYEDTYALPKDIFGTGDLFMLRASGNSMVDIGINSGDLLVLRQQASASDGEIVVALIEGEATLKRLFRRDGKIVLHPENKKMKDIIVDDCTVQGVLVSCIKQF